jgi:protein-tyrosine phosphatase
VIDLHNHVLPGLDDGPGTAASALALARLAAGEGTTTLVATPHVNRRYGVDPLVIEPAVAELRRTFEEQGLEIELVAGAELSLQRLDTLDEAQLQAVAIGESNAILLECPFSSPAGALEPALAELQDQGFRVVLAHPERCPGLLSEPRLLARLVAAGAWCSITAGSLAGDFGRLPRETAMQMLRDGLVHNIASDAHDHEGRPPSLRRGLAAASAVLPGFEPLGSWLVSDGAAAILSGGEPSERPVLASPPEPQQRGRGWPWRRGRP